MHGRRRAGPRGGPAPRGRARLAGRRGHGLALGLVPRGGAGPDDEPVPELPVARRPVARAGRVRGRAGPGLLALGRPSRWRRWPACARWPRRSSCALSPRRPSCARCTPARRSLLGCAEPPRRARPATPGPPSPAGARLADSLAADFEPVSAVARLAVAGARSDLRVRAPCPGADRGRGPPRRTGDSARWVSPCSLADRVRRRRAAAICRRSGTPAGGRATAAAPVRPAADRGRRLRPRRRRRRSRQPATAATLDDVERAYGWFLGRNDVGHRRGRPGPRGLPGRPGGRRLNPNQGAEFDPRLARGRRADQGHAAPLVGGGPSALVDDRRRAADPPTRQSGVGQCRT